jgi:hypothetical protein
VKVTAVGGKIRGRSEHGRSEVVVLVREALRVTAVHFANCDEGYGRASARPTDVRQAQVVASQSAAVVRWLRW